MLPTIAHAEMNYADDGNGCSGSGLVGWNCADEKQLERQDIQHGALNTGYRRSGDSSIGVSDRDLKSVKTQERGGGRARLDADKDLVFTSLVRVVMQCTNLLF